MPYPFIARPALLDAADPDPLVPTGRPVGWGVVATGGIAGTVSADLALLPDAVLRAVSSRDGARAGAFAERHGFAAAYGDGDGRTGHERLVADPDVEVVYVATPHGQHHAVARAALEAGKHVLVEKPLTVTATEAVDLVELARARSLFLMEAVWSRFVPAVQRAFQIAGSGELGTVHWVGANLGFPAPADPTSRMWAPAAGGGALLDLAVYPLLWAWGTLGPPRSVTAVGTLTPDGVDAQEALVLGYESGATAQVTTSLLAYSPHTALVCGSAGWLRAEGEGALYKPARLEIGSPGGRTRTETFELVGNGYAGELREVTRCVQEGRTESPTMPLDDTLASMRLLDRIRAQLGVRHPNDDA